MWWVVCVRALLGSTAFVGVHGGRVSVCWGGAVHITVRGGCVSLCWVVHCTLTMEVVHITVRGGCVSLCWVVHCTLTMEVVHITVRGGCVSLCWVVHCTLTMEVVHITVRGGCVSLCWVVHCTLTMEAPFASPSQARKWHIDAADDTACTNAVVSREKVLSAARTAFQELKSKLESDLSDCAARLAVMVAERAALIRQEASSRQVGPPNLSSTRFLFILRFLVAGASAAGGRNGAQEEAWRRKGVD
jgi:hypothetical protein